MNATNDASLTSPSEPVAANVLVRGYTLTLGLDGAALYVTCTSNKTNAQHTVDTADMKWGHGEYCLKPDFREQVQLSLPDTVLSGKLHHVMVVSSDDGKPARVGNHVVSPLFAAPGNSGNQRSVDIHVIAATPDQLHASKCPVKVVFGPRLRGN